MNDFALFDEPQYQEYKKLKNKDYTKIRYGCLAAIVLYSGNFRLSGILHELDT